MPRIIDKIREKENSGEGFFSFEYFPPRTDAGSANLLARLDRMSNLNPLFIDVTWGAGGTTADRTLFVSEAAQNYVGLETMMHLTCTNQTVESVKEALRTAYDAGIQNILALRGDPPEGCDEWVCNGSGLRYGSDLVSLIRAEYGDHFGIAVAGYPNGHPESSSYEDDLANLKTKVDAGADFIISQLFFDANEFLRWERDCRAIGITCPILPGVLPIQSYASLRHLSKMASTPIPEQIKKDVEAIRNDDEAVRDYGVCKAVEMITVLQSHGVQGIHFYTLNREVAVSRILKELDMLAKGSPRSLPWKTVDTVPKRAVEDVRPIFWSNRQKSYLVRTQSWDEFPNGRWGDNRLPSFGAHDNHYLFALEVPRKNEKLLDMWGKEINSVADVAATFVAFCEGKIPALPWIDDGLDDETSVITGPLLTLNQRHVLTINSQPRVNAASSDDPVHGWGAHNGYVYQKAYVEFFIDPTRLQTLIEAIEAHPSLVYHAVNKDGQSFTNNPNETTTSVTWGVFPGREIISPTVVDPSSFHQWAPEAFHLWSKWGDIYPEDSKSAQVIREIQDTWFLVNIVDNDFIAGDIFAVFDYVPSSDESDVPVDAERILDHAQGLHHVPSAELDESVAAVIKHAPADAPDTRDADADVPQPE